MKKILLFLVLITTSTSALSKEFTWKGKDSDFITFNVPNNVKSMLISVEYNGDNEDDIIIKKLVSSSDTTIIKSNINTPSESRIPPKVYSVFNSKVRVTYVTKGKFSAFISSKSSRIESGEWRLQFSNKKNTQNSKVNINIKYITDSDIEDLSISIDVHTDIYNSTLTPNSINKVLTDVKSFYKESGVTINFNLNESWRSPYTNITELEKKIEHLQNGKKDHLQLYLVKRKSSVKRDFQGVAGCLPFVIIESTNQHCSLLVAYQNQSDISLDKMTKVISHELAHTLGLYHLSDDFFPFGKVFDQMSDTNEDIDHSNVMHKTSEYFGHISFSTQQIELIRTNPILQKNRMKSILLKIKPN